MKYLNNNNLQYILSFPQKSLQKSRYLFKSDLTKNLNVHPDISIITTINDPSSLFLTQVKNNGWFIYTTSDNNLNNLLKTIKTKYSLIINQEDCLILESLDNNFLETFLSLNIGFCFAGLNCPIPNENLEGLNELLNMKGYFKYLNSSLIFGFTENLKDFYSQLYLNLNFPIESFESRNYMTRLFLYNYYLNSDFSIDSNNLLFTSILKPYTYIKEDLHSRYIQKGQIYNSLIYN